MPILNMRGLQDSRRLKAWLTVGRTVELRDRDRVIGRIVPERPQEASVVWPDSAARMKEIFGDRVFPNAVIEERRRSRY